MVQELFKQRHDELDREEKKKQAIRYTDLKKNFLIYKEIQMGSGAKSYMRKGFLIYEEAVSHV